MTDKTLEKRDANEIVVAGLSRKQVGLIKRTIAAGLSDDELQLFLYQAERTGLDPLARQIYAFKSGGKVSIGAYIDGLRLLADRTGRYLPGRPTEYQMSQEGELLSATAYVKKYVPQTNEWAEIAETAYYTDFKKPTPPWRDMPRVMLAKCAEARALRRAFPADLSGIFTDDEFPPPADPPIHVEAAHHTAADLSDAELARAYGRGDVVDVPAEPAAPVPPARPVVPKEPDSPPATTDGPGPRPPGGSPPQANRRRGTCPVCGDGFYPEDRAPGAGLMCKWCAAEPPAEPAPDAPATELLPIIDQIKAEIARGVEAGLMEQTIRAAMQRDGIPLDDPLELRDRHPGMAYMVIEHLLAEMAASKP